LTSTIGIGILGVFIHIHIFLKSPTPMIQPYTNKIKISLKKVNGQLKLIEKMIDEDRYCVSIAQQINAAIGLLKQANNSILESHLLSCGGNKLNSRKTTERLAFAQELIKAFNLTTK